MWSNYVILLIQVITTCLCAENRPSDQHYHHKHKHKDYYYHDLLYGSGLLSYLTFIAIKIKIAFVIGVIIAVFLFVGKLFALIKYGEHMKDHDHHHRYNHYDDHSFQPSGDHFSSDVLVDHLPPGALVDGNGGYKSLSRYGTTKTNKIKSSSKIKRRKRNDKFANFNSTR